MAGSVSIETKACSHPTPTSRLSEENLRRHNVEFQKLDNHYQMDQSRSAVQAADAVSYDQVDGDMDDIDIDSDMPDSEIALRRKASLDVLKLYSGALASLTTPMSRFVDMKPTRISRSWITKNVMDEPAIAGGEADTHDLRTLVSDMVDVAHAGVQSDTWDAGRRVCGSPRPDSDTLSNPDINDLEPEAKRAMHTKHIGIAKRSRLDRMKIPRSVPTSAMA